MTKDFKEIQVSYAELALLKVGGGRCFYCPDYRAVQAARQTAYAHGQQEGRVYRTSTQNNGDGSYIITVCRDK